MFLGGSGGACTSTGQRCSTLRTMLAIEVARSPVSSLHNHAHTIALAWHANGAPIRRLNLNAETPLTKLAPRVLGQHDACPSLNGRKPQRPQHIADTAFICSKSFVDALPIGRRCKNRPRGLTSRERTQTLLTQGDRKLHEHQDAASKTFCT